MCEREVQELKIEHMEGFGGRRLYQSFPQQQIMDDQSHLARFIQSSPDSYTKTCPQLQEYTTLLSLPDCVELMLIKVL